jgi:hypothetical protein
LNVNSYYEHSVFGYNFSFVIPTQCNGIDYSNQPQGVFDMQNQNEEMPSNDEYFTPYHYKQPITNQKNHSMLPTLKHTPYSSSAPEAYIPNAPYLKEDGRRATPAEIAFIKQYYRHVNVHDKIPEQNFVNFHFIYAPPLAVQNFAKKLKYKDKFEQEVINQFATQYKANVDNTSDLLMDSMNFGVTFSYGTRKNYDILTEWQVFLFQGRYIADKQFKGDATNFQVEYVDGEDEVSVSYQNVEFIQRTIGIHYNVYKEYLDLLKDSPNVTLKKIVPYFMAGIGLSSQFEFLRLSNGRLGMGGLTGGRTTKQNFFSIKPSFGVALGARYMITKTISFDTRVATLQVIPNINIRNFNLQVGARFYF